MLYSFIYWLQCSRNIPETFEFEAEYTHDHTNHFTAGNHVHIHIHTLIHTYSHFIANQLVVMILGSKKLENLEDAGKTETLNRQ